MIMHSPFNDELTIVVGVKGVDVMSVKRKLGCLRWNAKDLAPLMPGRQLLAENVSYILFDILARNVWLFSRLVNRHCLSRTRQDGDHLRKIGGQVKDQTWRDSSNDSIHYFRHGFRRSPSERFREQTAHIDIAHVHGSLESTLYDSLHESFSAIEIISVFRRVVGLGVSESQ